jgi:protein SCO1
MVAPGEPQTTARRGRPAFRRRHTVIALVLAAAAVVGVVLALALPSSSAGSSKLAGLAVKSPKAAPALALRNYLGNPVNLAGDRGKAVLVTFLYTHCPDVCPLIASKLHTAITSMNATERRQVQIIAVSVDPVGDTPKTIAHFLADHRMTGQMQYLIGTQRQLGDTWVNWGITSKPDVTKPEVVDHTALIYGINAHGQIAAVYPSDFAPGEIVHDVPILAGA